MGRRMRTAGLVLLVLLVWMLEGCACRVPVPPGTAPIQTTGSLTLYRHPIEIRISRPPVVPASPVLVVYATGDGGWRGVDNEVFRWIEESGWPIAGFSSKNYLNNLGFESETDTTTPRRLVRDYRRIIDFALGKLGLPADTRILLVGNSRGAGLSVVAAGQGELKPHLAGVVGIALTKEEEHVLRFRRRGVDPQQPHPNRETLEIKTYQYLPRLSSFPVCVIQSTNDGYLPAEAARRLFGPDGPFRRFRPVSARNHRFSGGCEKLHGEVVSALAWIKDTLQINHQVTKAPSKRPLRLVPWGLGG